MKFNFMLGPESQFWVESCGSRMTAFGRQLPVEKDCNRPQSGIAIKPRGKITTLRISSSVDSRIDISINLDIIRSMELLEIFKALSNPTRLEILKGLKDPVKNFPPQDEGDVLTVGVCVSSIQEGIGLSQSTVSGYLATLQRVGLVEVRRIGQWTYYKRNEATISALAEIIGKEL
jgi:ArsR family transcriptional regulator